MCSDGERIYSVIGDIITWRCTVSQSDFVMYVFTGAGGGWSECRCSGGV